MDKWRVGTMRYFILATRRIELSGIVRARSKEAAIELAKKSWYIHDTQSNSITSGSTSTRTPAPRIAEMEDAFRILHIRNLADEEHAMNFECPTCGAQINKKCRSLQGTVLKGFHPERKA